MDVFGFGMRDADRAIIFANLPLYLRCIAAARATTAADGRVRRSVCDCKGAYGDGGGAAILSRSSMMNWIFSRSLS